jgi:hypothetical protein
MTVGRRESFLCSPNSDRFWRLVLRRRIGIQSGSFPESETRRRISERKCNGF